MKKVINVYMSLNKETNQNTGAIQKQMNKEAKDQEIILNAVAKSGDLKAAYALWDLIVEKTRLQSKNKRLSESAKQMETVMIINIVCVFIYLLIHSLFFNWQKNCKGIIEINNNILTLLMCETNYKDAIRI